MVRLVRDLHALGEMQYTSHVRDICAGLDGLLQRYADEGVLDAEDRAIARFVVRSTLRPGLAGAPEVKRLRDAGLDDVTIHDVALVAACFAFMNRLADSLGAVIEPRKHAFAKELFGDEAVAAHLASPP